MLVEPSKCCRRHGLHISALTCGANPGSAVTPDYVGPFTFTGTLHSVTIDVSGDLNHDSEADLRVHLARQ
jgi:arylsulfatase